MLDFLRHRAVLLLGSMLFVTACAACAGNPFTETQGAVSEVYAATSTVDQDALATIEIYNALQDTATAECARPETPLELCEALEAVFDQTSARVALAAEAWASVMAYRIIIADLQASENPEAAALIGAAQAALAQALADWVALKPKIEHALETGAPLIAE